MSSLGRDLSLAIVNALRSGTVPPEGLEHFAVGIDDYVKALEEQREFVTRGRCAYKFIRGAYGSGKTFLSGYAAAEALKNKYAVSKVVISAADAPLFKLSEIYRRICHDLTVPGRKGGALQSVLDRWLYGLEREVIEVDCIAEDSPGFKDSVGKKVEHHLTALGPRAGRMTVCIKAYHDAQFDQSFTLTRGILDWLSGESKVSADVKRAAGITGSIDNNDALIFLRGLLELLKTAGYKGLLVILDECETIMRLRRPERLKSLEVLRQFVDSIDRNEFPGLHLLMTGTPDFFENNQGVPLLEPLHDRIRVTFNDGEPENLRQPQIRLHPANKERLFEIARKIRTIYPGSSPSRVMEKITDGFIDLLTDQVTRGFGGHVNIVPRLFLREFIHVLDLVDQYDTYDPMTRYCFDKTSLAKDIRLNPEEELSLESAAREVSF